MTSKVPKGIHFFNDDILSLMAYKFSSIVFSNRLLCAALKRSDCVANFSRLSSAFLCVSLALSAWLWRSSVNRRMVISRSCSALRSSRDYGCISTASTVPTKRSSGYWRISKLALRGTRPQRSDHGDDARVSHALPGQAQHQRIELGRPKAAVGFTT